MEQDHILARQGGTEGAATANTKRIGLAAVAVVCLTGMVAAFGTVDENPVPPQAQTVIQTLQAQARVLPASLNTPAAAGSVIPVLPLGALPSTLPATLGTPLGTVAAPAAEAPAPQTFWHEERFERGDTLAAILERLGVDDADVQVLLRSPAARPFRFLRPGITVQARVTETGGLQSLWFLSGRDTLVSIDRLADTFTASERAAPLTKQVLMKSGEIRSSLFAATDAAGLSDSVATQIADIFAGDVDFHRDLRRGDRFTVVYEMYFHNGRAVKSGRVLGAEFVNGKKAFRAVYFEGAEGKGYYTPDGKNLRKAFLRSPLEFSRVSSGFGMRHHPIMQTWRAHKGVDYAAPGGTRVRATSDAVVESAGRQGGYGNMVVLRHHGGITTVYAHLQGFAPNVKKGARVSQGEVIGYVGQTGWATGPHLHYEFRVNNEHRNPLTIAFPAALPVPAAELAAFRGVSGPLATRLDMLRETNLALLE
jgi:murein DD-endopeptidase MepM/ murein hydrolase activator NlpD